MRTAVIGAGLFGRMLAWRLLERGASVTLMDKHARDHIGAGRVAAGMIAPSTEAALAEPIVEALGMRSLALWPHYLDQLSGATAQPIFYRKTGTLVVAHAQDQAKWVHFMQRAKVCVSPQYYACLNKTALQEAAPSIAQTFDDAGYFPQEAVVDNHQLFDTLAQFIDQSGASWHENTEIETVGDDGYIDGFTQGFDHVFDCRGVGASQQLKTLRAVRGEVVRVWAPEVDIHHSIRLMHPRFPLYIAPRQNHHYVVGATQIESRQEAPVTVRSALELLSGLYSLHPGFAEAQITSLDAACRPAYEDNLPRVQQHNKRFTINGLYRHGYLFTPAILADLMALMDDKPPKFPEVFH